MARDSKKYLKFVNSNNSVGSDNVDMTSAKFSIKTKMYRHATFWKQQRLVF